VGAASKLFDELLQSVRGVGEEHGATVYAYGSAPPTSAANPAAQYFLAGIEQSKGSRVDLIERLAAAYNDKTWRVAAAKRLEVPALTKLPLARAVAAPANLGLPAGTRLHQLNIPAATLELIARDFDEAAGKAPKEPSKGDKARADVKWSVIALKDGDRTWVAWGPDEALLAAKLRTVLSGTGDQVLGSKPGLEHFKNEPAAVAGFASVVHTLSRASEFALGPSRAMPPEQLKLVMPHQGQAPVRVSIEADPSGPKAWLRVGIPAQAMEDVAAGVVAIIAAGQDAF
jgi:hypothetical protein